MRQDREQQESYDPNKSSPVGNGLRRQGEEGKVRMERGGHDEEVASSKFNTSIQKSIPYL